MTMSVRIASPHAEHVTFLLARDQDGIGVNLTVKLRRVTRGFLNQLTGYVAHRCEAPNLFEEMQ